jgi:hypothetical protein
MKKLLSFGSIITAIALIAISFAAPAQAATPWNTTGNYVVNMEYLGIQHPHDMSLTQDGLGNLTGSGGSPAGGNTYTWVITSGTVSGNSIDFLANYTATPDAVVPQTVLHVTGTIAMNGTISGTWSDNYQGGSRTGALTAVSGSSTPLGVLSAEDFGVVNYDTGLGMLKGYTAGFGLVDNTFASSTSVVVKLYGAGDQLLQTNTAILSKFNADITGTQFSSPFDVSGNFAYATDGYWTNVREAQYGQSVPAVKVVATVTLQNGKVVTATNTNLTGNPSSIFPVANSAPVISGVSTSTVIIPELSLYSFDANATDSDVPPQILTFSLSGAPAGASISSSTGVFMWTPSEAQGPGSYTFGIRVSDGSLGDGQSVTIHVTEVGTPVPPNVPTDKDQCKKGGWKTFTNPTFKNQGQCVSYTNHH